MGSKALMYSSPECFVEVTDGPSGRTGDEHWQINMSAISLPVEAAVSRDSLAVKSIDF